MTVFHYLEAAKVPGYYEAMGNIEKGSGDTINVPEIGANIGGKGNGFFIDTETNLDPVNAANRDSSFTALALGDDIYLYALKPTTETVKATLKFSKNSTFPTGSSASDSRKIGGFHYGRVRNSITITDVSTAIVSNSVWDLKNRPKCDPTGMVNSGAGFWVDIYLASVGDSLTFNGGNGYELLSGTAKSIYGGTPLTGTEGLSGDNFNELAGMTNKRLLTLAEWRQIAKGSPQGNDGDNVNAWSATTNSARTTCGAVAYAISLLNAVDCVGNVYEWVDEYSNNHSSTVWAWHNVYPGMGVGQNYLPNSTGISQYAVGLFWNDGVRAGSRSLGVNISPWDVNVSLGSRLACDNL
ncbi:hypothetical protein KAR91_55870 [Candidatus Pacearchaeota archaeon]|nr:hypothetical protein [Candidatus Pacearchaeota archaeon]